MKKIFSPYLLCLFLLSIMPYPGFSQKAADILEKMIETQGGRKILESIKDITLKVSIESDLPKLPMPKGMSSSMTWYKKEPNKMRMDVEATGMGIRTILIKATDGETAWDNLCGPGGTREMHEERAKAWKRNALGYDALLHPEKYGIIYSYKSKEKIESKDYFVLEQTFSDGYKKTHYVDSETYLIYKTNGEIMSDYKKVDGVTLAHCITVFRKGEVSTKITFTEVKFNTGLEDSLFKRSK